MRALLIIRCTLPSVHAVDKELLRKRAEHNDGELSSLKEVTLHQYDIEKIENLDTYCRHLEILFLQNNQISKIGTICLVSKSLLFLFVLLILLCGFLPQKTCTSSKS